jgi:putative ABC transport system permease protein
MKLVMLGLRNLARNRRRTAISLAIVGSGTLALLLTAGFIRYSFDGLKEAIIHGGLGHLEVTSAEAVVDRPPGALDRSLHHGLANWRELQADLEALLHVEAAAATLQVMGMAALPDGDPVSFIGLGVEPERERRMGFTVRLLDGNDLDSAAPADGDDRVLLGRGLADALGAHTGDVVTLLTLNADGMLNALDVQVEGIVTTGVADLDTRFLKLHLHSARRLLQTDLVSNLVVGLDRTEHTAAAKAAVEAAVVGRPQPLAVISWQERASFYGQVRNLYLGIFGFLGSIVFVLVVLACSNTLVMAVMERMRELGTLRAIGTTGGQLAVMLLAEAVWLGVLGGLAGDLAGLGAIALINALRLTMPPPPGAVTPIDLQLAYVPEAFAGAVALMVVVLALAALVPIVKAVRLRVVEALGHV